MIIHALLLFAYTLVANLAMSVVPHEPAIIFYGRQMGVFPTAIIATVGTAVACWIDVRWIFPSAGRVWKRLNTRPTPGWVGRVERVFSRAPFLIVACSSLTPLPFWPFKVLAYRSELSSIRYLSAVIVGRFPRHLLLATLGTMAPRVGAAIALVCLIVALIPLLRARRSCSKPTEQIFSSNASRGVIQ